MAELKNREVLVSFLLRAGICIAFLYAGTSALINPSNWIGFVPQWISVFLDRELFLITHGITDLLIGLWLLSGVKPFYSGLIAALSLISIIIVNYNQLEIIFRDIAILFAAISLMVLSYKRR